MTTSIKPALAEQFTTTNGDQPHNGQTRVEIYIGGSSLGNPGPSGWGFVALQLDSSGAIIAKAERNCAARYITTNHCADIVAAINALGFMKAQQNSGNFSVGPVTIFSNSEYVVKGITERLSAWLARGWRTSKGKEPENSEFWKSLLEATQGMTVDWRWIKGKSGNTWNARAHALASEAAKVAARRGVTFR